MSSGISNIVTVVLLIAVAAVLIIFLYVWVLELTKDIFVKIDDLMNAFWQNATAAKCKLIKCAK